MSQSNSVTFLCLSTEGWDGTDHNIQLYRPHVLQSHGMHALGHQELCSHFLFCSCCIQNSHSAMSSVTDQFTSSFHLRKEWSTRSFPSLCSHLMPLWGRHQIHPIPCAYINWSLALLLHQALSQPTCRKQQSVQRASVFARSSVPFGLSQQLLWGWWGQVDLLSDPLWIGFNRSLIHWFKKSSCNYGWATDKRAQAGHLDPGTSLATVLAAALASL